MMYSSTNSQIEPDTAGLYHLFVGNLPFTFTELDIQNIVADRRVDGCLNIRIASDKRTGKSRGFAFIDFDSASKLQAALEAFNGIAVEGRTLKVDITNGVDGPTKGRRRELTSKDFSVFIGNLHFGIGEEDLETIVRGQLGEDTAVKVRLVRVEGRSRGYGHIDFSNEKDVQSAIEVLNGMELLGRAVNVEPARSVSGANRVKATVENTSSAPSSFVPRQVPPRGSPRSAFPQRKERTGR